MRTLKLERKNLVADLMAGLTFAVVNVPQAMAHALLAAVSPLFGIYTLMIAVPVGAIFTSSVYMNVSTTSALSVATGTAIVDAPLDQQVEALAVLVLLVGLFQLLLGICRLGSYIRFVSHSVMIGFLNGVAVLIILGQLGDLTGYESTYSNKVARAMDLSLHLAEVHVQSTIVGLIALALIFGLGYTRLRKLAYILGLVVATLLVAGLGWEAVPVVGDVADIPRALPLPQLPRLSLVWSMLLPAISIGIIGLVQAAGVGQSYPNPDGKYPDVSRDFLGQGVANLATGFFSGIPAGGSISGTAVILGAGGRSRWANIFVGVFVALIVLIFGNAVELVPMPALAALLIVAGIQGLRIEQARIIWQTSRVSGTMMVLTFVATLFIPLQYAVLIGVVLSVTLHVLRAANEVTLTEIVPVPGGLPEERPAPRELPSNQITILQIYGSIFFAAAKTLEEMLPAVDNTTHGVVILRLRGHVEVGSTFVGVLRRYVDALQAHDCRLFVVGVSPGVREQLSKTGLLSKMGADSVIVARPQLGATVNQALAVAQAWLEQQEGKALLLPGR